MRKVLGIISYVIAGFFIYMVCLLSFINQPAMLKWGIIGGFSIPAFLFLCIGLAVNRFRAWKRHSGFVLLSGTGLTCFIIFTFACFRMSDELKTMMQPDALEIFNGYFSGGIFTFCIGALAIILMKLEKMEVEHHVQGDLATISPSEQSQHYQLS